MAHLFLRTLPSLIHSQWITSIYELLNNFPLSILVVPSMPMVGYHGTTLTAQQPEEDIFQFTNVTLLLRQFCLWLLQVKVLFLHLHHTPDLLLRPSASVTHSRHKCVCCCCIFYNSNNNKSNKRVAQQILNWNVIGMKTYADRKWNETKLKWIFAKLHGLSTSSSSASASASSCCSGIAMCFVWINWKYSLWLKLCLRWH